jgi:hypothetical protein
VITQQTAKMGDPSEHVAWALRNMPTIAGAGAVTNPAIIAEWSKHLYMAGFRHVSTIAELANEDGYIHVSALPEQQIMLREAFRGPRNGLNQAARWVPVGSPDAEPVIVPDINDMTAAEREALLNQFRTAGDFTDRYAPEMSTAQVTYD